MHTLTCHLSICVQGDFGVQYECLSVLFVKGLSSDQWRGTTGLMKTFVCATVHVPNPLPIDG